MTSGFVRAEITHPLFSSCLTFQLSYHVTQFSGRILLLSTLIEFLLLLSLEIENQSHREQDLIPVPGMMCMADYCAVGIEGHFLLKPLRAFYLSFSLLFAVIKNIGLNHDSCDFSLNLVNQFLFRE